jgi:hypothetical protein
MPMIAFAALIVVSNLSNCRIQPLERPDGHRTANISGRVLMVARATERARAPFPRSHRRHSRCAAEIVDALLKEQFGLHHALIMV